MHIDVKNEYIAALVYYVYKKAKTDKGTAVVVRTAEICGVDRRCGWAMRVAMMALVEAGMAVRHKPGVYMIDKNLVDRALNILRSFVGKRGRHALLLVEEKLGDRPLTRG